jgi:hypothetical protein
MRIKNKRTRQRTRSTSQTTQGQATNAFGEVVTIDDGVGVGVSVTRQWWLTSSQRRAQELKTKRGEINRAELGQSVRARVKRR